MSRQVPQIKDENVQRLLLALDTGHYLDRAARLAGLSRQTVYNWLQHGEDARSKIALGEELTDREKSYLEIADGIIQAKESAAHRALSAVMDAATNGTWQAAAWYLERTDSEHYGRTTQVVGKDNGPIKLDITVEDVEALLQQIAEADDANSNTV